MDKLKVLKSSIVLVGLLCCAGLMFGYEFVLWLTDGVDVTTRYNSNTLPDSITFAQYRIAVTGKAIGYAVFIGIIIYQATALFIRKYQATKFTKK